MLLLLFSRYCEYIEDVLQSPFVEHNELLDKVHLSTIKFLSQLPKLSYDQACNGVIEHIAVGFVWIGRISIEWQPGLAEVGQHMVTEPIG